MEVDVAERRSTAARRIEYIELLSEQGPLHPRDLVERLDDSRSTVTRALEELREADLVRRRTDGYVSTVAATMVAEEYRRHEKTSRAILEASELVDPLPNEAAPPPAVLTGGRTHVTDPSAPFRPLETVSDRLRDADAVRAYLPTLVNPSLLRLWHGRVTTEAVESTGLFADDLLSQLRGQYPELLGEMRATSTFSALTVDGPPYALFLTAEDGTRTMTIVVYDGEGGVQGVLVNDSATSVEWARTRLDELESVGTPVSDEISAAVGDDERASGRLAESGGRAATADGDDGGTETPLPLDLKTEGFVRLSDDYFDGRQTAPPAVSWQTGFTLTEVRAGQAVDRVDDDGQSLVGSLLEALREGTDHVVVGPPGAGKSTTCMAVACEWFERGVGPVLYRERGRGDEFTSGALLEAYLRETEGHTLVVVEDAIRPETNDILELTRTFAGSDDVTFLLDSRATEWNQSDGVDLDPRVRAYRRRSIREVSLPELDKEEYERFASHFERLVGDGSEPADDSSEAEASGERSHHPGENALPETPLLAQARLSRRHTAVSARMTDDRDVIQADIEETYRSLEDADAALATDLAVLVSLLNAAGIPVAAEYLYTLSDGDRASDVETAITELEGTVLFERQSAGGASSGREYRTRHEEWSRGFLRQLLEFLPDADAKETFGRGVSRLLALADDDDQRAQIRRRLSVPTPRLGQVEADPSGWADEVARRIFSLGQSHSRLAPLYGLTDDDIIELPEACSPLVEYKQAWWRADMNGYQGATERAKSEIERLTDVQAMDTGLTEAEADRLRCLSHRGLAMYARIHGDNDAAHRHASQALELAREWDDALEIVYAHELLRGIETRRLDVESAREHVDALRRLADEYDDPTIESILTRNEAALYLVRGEYDAVERRLRPVLEGKTEKFDDTTVGYGLKLLSDVALIRNDLDLAERALTTAREVSRSAGLSMGLSRLHSLFADLALCRGDLEEAERHLSRAVENASGVPRLVSAHACSKARLERTRGNLAEAVEAAREAVDAATTTQGPIEKTDAVLELVEILLQRGDVTEAAERLERLRETLEVLGNDVKLAVCDRLRARVEFERDILDEAEHFATRALETFAEEGIDDEAAECLRLLGLVALERGDETTANERLERGFELATDSGVVRTEARLHEAVGQAKLETGDQETARRHLEQAVERFDRLGDTDRSRELRTKLVEYASIEDD